MTDRLDLRLCNLTNAHWFDRGSDNVLTDDNLAALRLCKRCPVRRDCAERILAGGRAARYGVIAGGMVFGQDGEQVRYALTATSERRRAQWREAKRRERHPQISTGYPQPHPLT